MVIERCAECGFNGDAWTDALALAGIADLPSRWRSALCDLDAVDLRRRPVPDMWSMLEYADHVREVLFGMRFVLDSAVLQPGIDLGDPPESAFEATPRILEPGVVLDGIAREAESLRRRLSEISASDWDSPAVVGDVEVDGHWICRHAIHDATHHLMDVQRLRHALRAPGRDRDGVADDEVDLPGR